MCGQCLALNILVKTVATVFLTVFIGWIIMMLMNVPVSRPFLSVLVITAILVSIISPYIG